MKTPEEKEKMKIYQRLYHRQYRKIQKVKERLVEEKLKEVNENAKNAQIPISKTHVSKGFT